MTEDGKLKGIRVSQAQSTNSLPYDIVFLVDNSGSMGEEADTVAEKILDFSAMLSQSGLDVRMGVVGFDGVINGGLDLTTAQDLKNFLTRPYSYYVGKPEDAGPEQRRYGTERTVDFAGPNQAALQKAANELNATATYDENGVLALVYAEHALSFRPTAQRIYIQFTDEPTQETLPSIIANRTPWNGVKDFHIKSYCASWKPKQGVVHTIWSGASTTVKAKDGRERLEPWFPWSSEEENPFDLSACTGGTQMLVKGSAEDLDLTQLTVTQALTSSALVEFITSNPNVAHKLEVTVKNGETADGRLTLEGKVY